MSETQKHTPWVAEMETPPGGAWPASICELGYGIWVRESHGIPDDIPDEETCRGNANLIAAAPDLKRAVQGALIVFDSLHNGLIAAGFPPIENAAFVRECLQAALAKAEPPRPVAAPRPESGPGGGGRKSLTRSYCGSILWPCRHSPATSGRTK